MFVVICSFGYINTRDKDSNDDLYTKIDKYVAEEMHAGNIPGMSIVIIQNNKITYQKGYGYADISKKTPVTADTSFEIASCSKGFTGLAVLKLQEEGLLNIQDPLSKYFQGFYATYKGKKYDIKLSQLLHHTSGIPWSAITDIPVSNDDNAVIDLAEKEVGIKLTHKPGEQFEYATINYALLGAVIQKVSGQLYEDYMQKTVFDPLGLEHTTLYPEKAKDTLATGYKNGFFRPIVYQAPIFRANRAAGYIIMDSNDVGKWLMYQMGNLNTPLAPLIEETHKGDRTVAPSLFDQSSYAIGWAEYQSGTGEVSKSGLNPNYSSYMAFRGEDGLAVGILANNGTNYTFICGHGILDMLRGHKKTSPYETDRKIDNICSVVVICMVIYIIAMLIFSGRILVGIAKKERHYRKIGKKKGKWVAVCISFLPFAYGIYLLPYALQQVSWETAIVWYPFSFHAMLYAGIVSIVATIIAMILGVLFSKEDDVLDKVPLLAILSVVSGISNTVIIFVVTISIGSTIPLYYSVYYFILCLFIYILGRKVIETHLVRIAYNLIYTKRMELIKKLLVCSYGKFENIDTGRLYATINNDTEQIGMAANVLVGFATSLITVICCLFYLGTLSLSGTLLTVSVIIIFIGFYSVLNAEATEYWEIARDTQNIFMNLLDHMLKGFKELALHFNRRKGFSSDIHESCNNYRVTRTKSRIKFSNSIILGESLLIIVLGVVAFVFPNIFPNLKNTTISKFVIFFLYLIGPINGLIEVIPDGLQIRSSWKRIDKLSAEIDELTGKDKNQQKDVPERINLEKLGNDLSGKCVESIAYEGISYEYSDFNDEKGFSIKPISIRAKRGEMIFIVGGNGSGKSTLAKMITGLYKLKTGNVYVDDKKIEQIEIGEYFSTVFSDFHLFEHLYEGDYQEKSEKVRHYLCLLGLEDKVSIGEDGRFSTLNLSTGQQKRLALLICYLEDRPVYLFDEWAADQDPEFRDFFYRTLLTEMKEKGKIIFVISHDERYFSLADYIVKMDFGSGTIEATDEIE